MWQESEGYSADDYGEKRTSEAKIYIPDLSADIRKGDFVTKNAVPPEITGNDVSAMLAAVIITKHDYGSPDMQHVKVVAQ